MPERAQVRSSARFRPQPPLRWLIVGGGAHGVHIAARLLAEKKASPESLRILDPGQRLLERWHATTSATGMTHLRSPWTHNLAMHPHSLRWHMHAQRGPGLPVVRKERPTLAAFNEHCQQVLRRYNLSALHIQGLAHSCEVHAEGAHTRTECGQVLASERVVLALGPGYELAWPAWAPHDHERISHVFARDFQWRGYEGKDVTIVGGGITAVQVALRLAREGARACVLSRHNVREHELDFHHRWLMPRRLSTFGQERSYARRRLRIERARYSGSVPAALLRELRLAIRAGNVDWKTSEVTHYAEAATQIHLSLASGEEHVAQEVLLATGFASRRPGGSLVEGLIQQEALPCAECGYPILDPALRWHPRIHVSGPLAELELGPMAGNISGARVAAQRIAACPA